MAISGLATTFFTLQESQNEAALSLLVQAMDMPTQAIHDEAMAAILARNSSDGHDLILKRLHLFDEPHLELVRKNGYLSPKSIRDALLGPDRQVCINGCQVILWFREYTMVQALLNALYDQQCLHEDLIGDTLTELLRTLSLDWINHGEGEKAGLAEQQRQKLLRDRQQVFETLRLGISTFGIQHRRTEPITGLFLLADFDDPLLPKILENPRHPAFAPMMNILAHNHDENVTKLLLSSYSQPSPLRSLLTIAANRSDDDFISKLIVLLRTQMNDLVKRNLRQIETISWVNDLAAFMEPRSEEDQVTLFQYLLNTKLPKDRLLEVTDFFLNQGKVDARRLASEAIAQFSGSKVNQILLNTLNDSDPVVQSNIIRTIHHRGIPEASARVFKLRHSPYEVVRNAIQETFDEYSFETFLAAYDMIDEGPRRTMGKLVYEIDSRTIPLLKKELKADIRNAKVRALGIVELLEVAGVVEDDLLDMIDGEDSMIQVLVLELLAKIPTTKAQQRIREALDDRNASVAGAAQRLLANT